MTLHVFQRVIDLWYCYLVAEYSQLHFGMKHTFRHQSLLPTKFDWHKLIMALAN